MPGGPAKACAITSHCRAPGPVASTAVSFQCRAGDQVGGIGRTPGPCFAGWPGQLHPNWSGRWREAVRGEAVRASPDADVGDMAEPGSRLADYAHCIGNVLAVCPGLHQPRGERGRDTHGRPVPGHPLSRVQAGKHRQEPGARPGEPVSQRGRAEVAVLRCDRVRLEAACCQPPGEVGRESFRVSRRGDSGLVEMCEMRDLVADSPAGSWRVLLPGRSWQRIDNRAERSGLGGQVIDQRGYVNGHRRPS